MFASWTLASWMFASSWKSSGRPVERFTWVWRSGAELEYLQEVLEERDKVNVSVSRSDHWNSGSQAVMRSLARGSGRHSSPTCIFRTISHIYQRLRFHRYQSGAR